MERQDGRMNCPVPTRMIPSPEPRTHASTKETSATIASHFRPTSSRLVSSVVQQVG
jgi:hypothetical protein